MGVSVEVCKIIKCTIYSTVFWGVFLFCFFLFIFIFLFFFAFGKGVHDVLVWLSLIKKIINLTKKLKIINAKFMCISFISFFEIALDIVPILYNKPCKKSPLVFRAHFQ